MKRILLVMGFLLLIWSSCLGMARATLFEYTFSVMMLSDYLFNPAFFGDTRVGVTFGQDTSLDYPQTRLFLPNAGATYSINDRPIGGFVWSLSEISPLDYRFGITDPGGRVQFDLLYDHNQSEDAPFREPDRLLVDFGAEYKTRPGVCNTITTPPCPIGTGGIHTFGPGEFDFSRTHVVPEPGSMVLAGVGFLGVALWLKRR